MKKEKSFKVLLTPLMLFDRTLVLLKSFLRIVQELMIERIDLLRTDATDLENLLSNRQVGL